MHNLTLQLFLNSSPTAIVIKSIHFTAALLLFSPFHLRWELKSKWAKYNFSHLCLKWKIWIDLFVDPFICFLGYLWYSYRSSPTSTFKTTSTLFSLVLQSPIFISVESPGQNHWLQVEFLRILIYFLKVYQHFALQWIPQPISILLVVAVASILSSFCTKIARYGPWLVLGKLCVSVCQKCPDWVYNCMLKILSLYMCNMHVKKRQGFNCMVVDSILPFLTHHRNSWLVLLRANKTNSEGRKTLSAEHYLQAWTDDFARVDHQKEVQGSPAWKGPPKWLPKSELYVSFFSLFSLPSSSLPRSPLKKWSCCDRILLRSNINPLKDAYFSHEIRR